MLLIIVDILTLTKRSAGMFTPVSTVEEAQRQGIELTKSGVWIGLGRGDF